jgi:hypothetical protein
MEKQQYATLGTLSFGHIVKLQWKRTLWPTIVPDCWETERPHHAEGRVDPKVDEGKNGFWLGIPHRILNPKR